MSRKDDLDFIKLIEEHVELDEASGALRLKNLYAQMCFNISHKGKMVVVPYSHVVWFKKYGRWPTKGMHVDHINDNPQDNGPENLQELTEKESQKKRRGRMVYRTYGTGKYGYGMYINHDKRDGRYYITRHLSRGHGFGDLKSIRRGLGGFDTLAEAEAKVYEYIEEVKIRGLDYLPPAVKQKQKEITVELNNEAEKFRKLRSDGHTIKEISELTGRPTGSIYSRISDLGITKMARGSDNGGGGKLTEENVRQIKQSKTNGRTASSLAREFGVSKTMIGRILNGKAWTHIKHREPLG